MSADGVQFGEFQLLRRLGSGGMAEVFLARRIGPEGFEKQLVVKRLLPHLARSERFTEMLLREARYAALVDHPNFVHVSSFGVVEDGYYLAMEYVDGLTVLELVSARGALSAGVAARIAIDLLDALHAIHTVKHLDGRELHLVHRDVTPGNVMITASGAVKVLDLGIAVPSNAVAPRRAGTRSYMSPEQARGETLDERSDLYCVGLLLCLMLTGQHPADMEVSSSLSHVPDTLRAIVEDLLEEEREDRPETAREVQNRLVSFAVTCGREATRVFLAELTGGVAVDPPSPSPRIETVSCMLSAVLPADPNLDPRPPEPDDVFGEDTTIDPMPRGPNGWPPGRDRLEDDRKYPEPILPSGLSEVSEDAAHDGSTQIIGDLLDDLDSSTQVGRDLQEASCEDSGDLLDAEESTGTRIEAYSDTLKLEGFDASTLVGGDVEAFVAEDDDALVRAIESTTSEGGFGDTVDRLRPMASTVGSTSDLVVPGGVSLPEVSLPGLDAIYGDGGVQAQDAVPGPATATHASEQLPLALSAEANDRGVVPTALLLTVSGVSLVAIVLALLR